MMAQTADLHSGHPGRISYGAAARVSGSHGYHVLGVYLFRRHSYHCSMVPTEDVPTSNLSMLFDVSS